MNNIRNSSRRCLDHSKSLQTCLAVLLCLGIPALSLSISRLDQAAGELVGHCSLAVVCTLATYSYSLYAERTLDERARLLSAQADAFLLRVALSMGVGMVAVWRLAPVQRLFSENGYQVASLAVLLLMATRYARLKWLERLTSL